MDVVDRRWFLPEDQHDRADDDAPLPIGHGATCSQPTTVVHMLDALDAGPGHRVLDVGSGSGWTTALLAHLVSPGGTVVGVELEPDLARSGAENLRRAGVPAARIHPARAGVLGRPEDGPYDRVLVSAESPEVPHALVEQLADPGRMVVPVAGRLLVIDRDAQGTSTTELGRYRFVPLR